MPQPAAVTEPVEALLELWSRTALWLEAEQASYTSDPDRLARYWRRERRIADELLPAVAGEMERLRNATRDYLTTGLPPVWEAGGTSALDAVDASDPFTWTLPHRAAVTQLANATWTDVLAATEHVQTDTARWARETGRALTDLSVTAGMTPTDAARRMARDGNVRGISAVKYRDGTRRRLGDYSDMLLRTRTALAYNGGTLVQTAQLGFTHVEIFDGHDCGLYDHGGTPRANGLVVPLDVAAQWPLAHPRCQRAFGPRTPPPGTRFDPPEAPAPGSFLYDPSSSDDQIQANATAKQNREQRRLRGTRRGRSERTPRTRRRPSGQSPNATAAGYTPGTTLARLDSDARAAVGRYLAANAKTITTRRARARRVPEASPELLETYGLTAEEFAAARSEIEAVRQQIRHAAAKERDRLAAWMSDNSVDKLAAPLPKRLVIDGLGNKRYVRDSPGYDWLEQLDKPALKRVEKRMAARSGTATRSGTAGGSTARERTGKLFTPDQLAERVQNLTSRDLSENEAMQWLIQLWDTETGLGAMARGKIPAYVDPAALVPDYATTGWDYARIFGPDLDEAAAHVAATNKQQALEYATRAFVDRNTGRPQPYAMTFDDYLDELIDIEDRATSARPIRSDDWGDVYSPEDQAALDRWAELVPRNIDLPDLGDGAIAHIDTIWERIQETARQAGLTESAL